YGLNPTTQTAAWGLPDPSRPSHPAMVPTPHTIYEPASNTGPRQRVFSLHDLPTRRDLAEAFQHVQSAARQTTNLWKRDVTELQLLEHFVEIWDCRCIGLSPHAKLRVFDRVRLLYHVALSGWGTALNGYADPSATFLLGPPPPRRATSRQTTVPRDTTPPPGPNTRSGNTAKRKSPAKKGASKK
ncbi:unnamed protein product, partial [Ixodes hexagonus]